MLSGLTVGMALFAVEIRAYNLKPGTRDEFQRVIVDEAVPLLEHWQVDLIAHGPSPHDDDSYFVIRAYEDLDARAASHAALYGSEEWRQGPRDRVLGLIESFTTIVLHLDAGTLERLRK